MDQQKSNFKKVGFVSKLNGFQGELVLASKDDDVFDAEFLFLKLDGINVPFHIEEVFEKGGNIIVRLEDVNDEVQAQRYVNSEVFMETKKKPGKHTLAAHELVNYRIIDAAYGDLGPILRIDELPQQEIAVCQVGGKQVLVPLNNDFIDEIDRESKSIKMTLPDGLIDLYLNP